VTTNNDQPYLRIERRFDVPPETVFDTLTDPDLMRIWWGDDAEIDIDLRVGGQWKIIRWERARVLPVREHGTRGW
jgi:uncharacterized protein YndB with AHSA1/START domain